MQSVLNDNLKKILCDCSWNSKKLEMMCELLEKFQENSESLLTDSTENLCWLYNFGNVVSELLQKVCEKEPSPHFQDTQLCRFYELVHAVRKSIHNHLSETHKDKYIEILLHE